jgi:hypothetical protein
MKKQDVRGLIYAGLEPMVAPHGFRVKKSEESFVRAIEAGKQSLGIALVDYNPVFEFSLTISIRLDQVEDILHMFSGSPPQYHRTSSTFISDMNRFQTSKPSYSVTTPEDIQAALTVLHPVVLNQIIPFFDGHKNLETVAQVMSLDSIPEMMPGAGPAMYAAIVARLTHNPNLESIVSAYQERLARFPKNIQGQFNNLVEYLRKF